MAEEARPLTDNYNANFTNQHYPAKIKKMIMTNIIKLAKSQKLHLLDDGPY